ncbi:MAG: DUF6600 domain-containing protein [Verrucomicrobiota bacterium]
MKNFPQILALGAALVFTFSLPVALRAQDVPPPPPPPADGGDQGAPPPPPADYNGNGAPPPPADNSGGPPPPADYNGGSPPPDGSAPPPPDAGQGGGPGGPGGDQGASFQEFYDQLGSEGQWIQTDDYGYVFQPNVTDPNWAPYTDGHWVYTDVGWTWASDEPWGWATYHYGRWANLDGTGWVWVPGYQWAPAWVSWRWGGGYAGWAPLPPTTFVGVEFGGPGVNLGLDFHFGSDVDVNFGIGPGCYNFIPIGYIGDPYYRGHFIDRGRNFVIINNTRNITNIVIRRGQVGAFRGVSVGGPALAEVNEHSHTPVRTVALARAGGPGRGALRGNTLSVFAPHVNPATLHQARPPRVAQTVGHAQVNRGDSISQPLAVNERLRPTAPSASAIQAAHTAAAQAPAGAHIGSAQNFHAGSAALSHPLTTMQTRTFTRTPQAATHAAQAPAFTGQAHAVVPQAQHPVYPQAQHAVAPQAQHPVVPEQQRTYTPQAQHAVVPQEQHVYAPQQQHSFAPQAQHAQAVQHQAAQHAPQAAQRGPAQGKGEPKGNGQDQQR